MFSIWVKFLELDDSTCPLMLQLQANKSHWKSQLDVEKTPANNHTTPAAAAVASTATSAPAAPTPSTGASTNVSEEKGFAPRSEPTGDGSNKVAPAPQ